MRYCVRLAIVAMALAFGGSLLAPVGNAGAVGDLSTVDVNATPVASGFDQPLALAWRAGDPDLYVVQQGGRIRRVHDGVLLKANVFSIRPSTAGEQGLLGLAFSPNGTKLYVDYTEKRTGNTVIEEYGFNPTTKKAIKKQRRRLLYQQQPFANHNGGTIMFGPDNLLYVAFGDGGSGGDPNGNGQNKNTLLGKILRISPTAAYGYQYSIPLDNPFVGQSNTRWDIWMYGLRNPWKFSFDKANGDMWIGDVGQGLYEEIDYAAAGNQAGANWGWNQREGAHPYNGGAQPPGGRDPIIERPHSAGDCAITGGYVYRGSAIPALNGAYIYGDFCTGKIYAAAQSGGALTQNVELPINVPQLSSFGQDASGEVYAVSRAGTVYKITPG
jgi:glucose/arabinose dehydrogenase